MFHLLHRNRKTTLLLLLTVTLIGWYIGKKYLPPAQVTHVNTLPGLTSPEGITKQQQDAYHIAHRDKGAKVQGIGWLNSAGKVVFTALSRKDEKGLPNPPTSTYSISMLTKALRNALKKGSLLTIDGVTYRSEGCQGRGANGEVYFVASEEMGLRKAIKLYRLAGERANFLKKIDLVAEAHEECTTHEVLFSTLPSHNIRKDLYYVGGGLPLLIQPLVLGDTVKKTIEKGFFTAEMGLAIYLMLMRLAEHHIGLKDLNPANIILTYQGGQVIPVIIDAHPPFFCDNFWIAYEHTVLHFLQKFPRDHHGFNAFVKLFEQAKKAMGTSLSQPDHIPEDQYKALKEVWGAISEGFGPDNIPHILAELEAEVNEQKKKSIKSQERV